MAALTGKFIGTPDDSYLSLLHFGSNDVISGTLVDIQDGAGNNTGLQISTTQLKYTGKFKFGTAVSTSAGSAPVYFTLGGTVMTTPEAGAMEATNTHIYWTDSGGTRYQLDQQTAQITVNSTVINSGGNNRILYQGSGKVQESANLTYDGSDFVFNNQSGIGTFKIINSGSDFMTIDVGANGAVQFDTNGSAAAFRFLDNVGFNTSAPTARVHIAAGTATASTAPLKLTTGTALTTPEDGAIEYHSSHLYFTIGSTRYQLDQQSGGSGITIGTTAITSGTDGRLLLQKSSVVDQEANLRYVAADGFYVTKTVAASAAKGTVNIGAGGFAGGGSDFAGNSAGTSLVVYEPTGFSGDLFNIGSYDVLGLIADNNASLGINIRPSVSDTHSNRILHIRQSSAVGVKLQTSSATFEMYVISSRGWGIYDITNGSDRITLLNNGHFQINNNTDLGSIFGITGLPTSNAGLSAGAVYMASAATVLSNGDLVMAVKQ